MKIRFRDTSRFKNRSGVPGPASSRSILTSDHVTHLIFTVNKKKNPQKTIGGGGDRTPAPPAPAGVHVPGRARNSHNNSNGRARRRNRDENRCRARRTAKTVRGARRNTRRVNRFASG